ncbi:MAG: hypothetical protein P4L22_07740 [Candidatus Babeliales bacterium]|nr:hypothetical protein [Candidatus Babeliales bacterium]
MKKIKSIFIIFLILCSTNLNGRKNIKTKYKKITPEEQLRKDLLSCYKLILILGPESYPECVELAHKKYEESITKKKSDARKNNPLRRKFKKKLSAKKK